MDQGAGQKGSPEHRVAGGGHFAVGRCCQTQPVFWAAEALGCDLTSRREEAMQRLNNINVTLAFGVQPGPSLHESWSFLQVISFLRKYQMTSEILFSFFLSPL